MTGQLFVRETGVEKAGKKVYMVFGVIGANGLEQLTLFGETQYTIARLELVDPISRKEVAKGKTPDSLLREPMWRV